MDAPSHDPDFKAAAQAYLDVLDRMGLLLLLLPGGRLKVPMGHTPAELALVALLKPHLIELLEARERDRFEERAALLEFEAGMTREEAEARARRG